MGDKIEEILKKIKSEGRDILTYEEARKVMELAEIPLNKIVIAKDLDDCIKKANEIGYPVVIKVVSKDIIHKSDAGGVKVGIKSDEELKKAYEEMLKSVKSHYPDAEIEGISVEEQVEGAEILIGSMTDPQFDKMIALGIGGIFTELYKDVTFRLIPITEDDVKEMIGEIKGKKIFDGFRGLPPIDKRELTDIMLKVSKLVEKHPQIKEMDLNPIVGTEKGLKAIDARVILE